MINRHTIRRPALAVGASISALVTAGAATAATAIPARAAADGCTHPIITPGSCVRVLGSGLYVQSITGGALLYPRQSLYGHNEIRFGNVIRNTPNTTYWNQSYTSRDVMWGPTIPINATLGDGTQVCSYLWRYNGGSNYSGPYGPACVTVHR
jgi:hypothetical protein